MLLPDMAHELGQVFARYERDRARRPEEQMEEPPVDEDEPEAEELSEDREYVEEKDEGSAATFFSWFFRGKGPRGLLSGAAFQKNRLGATSSAYATLFEDDIVSWLLGRPSDVIGTLAQRLGRPRADLSDELRRRAYHHFRNRTLQQDGHPRLYVFEAYQAVALGMLEGIGEELGEKAGIVINERYPEATPGEQPPPAGFPSPEEALGTNTFFTELIRRPPLRDRIWPDEELGDFREYFRRREQRRELISSLARLGASYIELYALAIRPLGSFSPGRQREVERPDHRLARDFADHLEKQMHEPGFHAFRARLRPVGPRELDLSWPCTCVSPKRHRLALVRKTHRPNIRR